MTSPHDLAHRDLAPAPVARCVTHAIRDGALWLQLNRPDALNALNSDTLHLIESGLDAVQDDATVRCVVISGAGRAFCTGADLKAIHAEGTADAFLGRLNATLNRLERFPKPVVAMANGLALAGGLELILCCDLVLAARSARLGDGHATYGLVPGAGASARLPRAVGAHLAKYLLFTGETVPAAELVASGLVHRVVDDDQLLDATTQLVAQIAAKSPLGLQRMKALVNQGLALDLPDALRLEAETLRAHQSSHHMREGLAAFQAKRPPRFTGR